MAPVHASWRCCQALKAKDEAFLVEVEIFLTQLQRLNADQKQRLALFKAAELINALMQIHEQRQDLQRTGPELAKQSFDLVRAVIRNRSLPLIGAEPVDLRDPALQDLIDEGCRLFHLGKADPEIYQRALALSAAQCIALHQDLGHALVRYADGCGFEIPSWLLDAVTQSFIQAYDSQAPATFP